MCCNLGSEQRASDGEITAAVVKTRAEQPPALAVWLPCTGQERCSISGSVLLQKQAEVPLACNKGYAVWVFIDHEVQKDVP